MKQIASLFTLLTRSQKRSALVLLFMMFLGMLLETLGVGMVIPVLAFLSQDNPLQQFPQLQPAFLAIGIPSNNELIAYIMIAMVVLYTFKTFFLVFVNWMQSKFVFQLQASLSQRIFSGYLYQPYTFHLQRNSSQLIQTVSNETAQFARSAMLPGMMLITETLVLIGICTLLLTIEPLGAILIILIMVFAGGFFYRYSRKRSVEWGKARQHHEGKCIQHVQQGLGGAKEVKLLGREENFIEQFARHSTASAKVWERQITLQVLPRLWLELLAVISLAALVLTMLWKGTSLDSIVPTLGLFAAAAFRLMPSFNRVLTALQNLRFALPVTTRLVNELSLFNQESQKNNEETFAFQNQVRISNVSYTYPQAGKPSLTELTISIPYGTSIGIIGSSGAGKSTLVDVLLGLLKPTAGQVLVDGQNIQSNLQGWMRQIGYVPQTIYLTDDSLRNNIAFGVPADEVNEAAIHKAIEAAQLEEFVGSLAEGLDTIVGERGVRLSGGQRQRIGIARALYNDPEILILDEATSALDTQTESDVMDAINALHGKKTIVIIAHRLSTLQQCDTIIHIEHGHLINADKPSTEIAKNR
jgi:ABC-type multidrug transport system fused ATPase/permease subunit